MRMPGRGRGDGPEQAADAVGGVGLEVERLLLRGPPHMKSCTTLRHPPFARLLLRREEIGQTQPRDTQATDAQKFPPRHPVAQPRPGAAETEHALLSWSQNLNHKEHEEHKEKTEKKPGGTKSAKGFGLPVRFLFIFSLSFFVFFVFFVVQSPPPHIHSRMTFPSLSLMGRPSGVV